MRKIEETQRQQSTSWQVAGATWCCTSSPSSPNTKLTWQGTSLFHPAAVSGDVTTPPWPVTSSCRETPCDVSTYSVCGMTTSVATERPDCDCKLMQQPFFDRHYYYYHHQQQHQLHTETNGCVADQASKPCSEILPQCVGYFWYNLSFSVDLQHETPNFSIATTENGLHLIIHRTKGLYRASDP